MRRVLELDFSKLRPSTHTQVIVTKTRVIEKKDWLLEFWEKLKKMVTADHIVGMVPGLFARYNLPLNDVVQNQMHYEW